MGEYKLSASLKAHEDDVSTLKACLEHLPSSVWIAPARATLAPTAHHTLLTRRG